MAGTQIKGKKLLKVQVGGQPKNLVVLREADSTKLFNAHPLVEAFNRENGTNLRVISHKVADVAQTVGDTWESLPIHPVDASIAYEKPGTRLGREVVFIADGEPPVVLATGKYKGEKDVALVALGVTSADFVRDGNSITLAIPDSRLIVVPRFPASEGWYMPHATTGVPHGKQIANSFDARYLYRLNGSSYVGLLVRYHGCGYSRWGVFADYRASECVGVVAEVPEEDVAKIEALLEPVETPPPTKKTVIEVANVSAERVKAEQLISSLDKLVEDFQTLTTTAKKKLLAVEKKLEAVLSGATSKE